MHNGILVLTIKDNRMCPVFFVERKTLQEWNNVYLLTREDVALETPYTINLCKNEKIVFEGPQFSLGQCKIPGGSLTKILGPTN